MTDSFLLVNLMRATGPVHRELEPPTLVALCQILSDFLTKKQNLTCTFQWTDAMSADNYWLVFYFLFSFIFFIP